MGKGSGECRRPDRRSLVMAGRINQSCAIGIAKRNECGVGVTV